LIAAARSGEVRRILGRLLGPGELRLRSITLGRGDRDKVIAVHAAQRYFVKLMSPTGAHATRAAAELGLAPRVVGSATLADGRTMVVQEFIAGASGGDPRTWMPARADELAAFFFALARREDLLSTLPVPLPQSPLQRAEIRLRDMHLAAHDIQPSGWDDAQTRVPTMLARMRALADALPDAPHALVPVHADPQTANWIRDATGRLYLVDWDYARLDDPVTDPARLGWWLFGSSHERRNFMLQCGVPADDPEVWQRAVWSVASYAGHTALVVARQGRLPRASYFLDLTDQLLDNGL
jgi:hypothetical protein